MIFTNQAGIGKAKATKEKKIAEVTGRLVGFVRAVGLPVQVFAATSNADGDPYRKPQKGTWLQTVFPKSLTDKRSGAAGMWEALLKRFNGGVSVDLTECFFVGDAAGRSTDHSDSDFMFARNIGIKFYTQDGYFLS